MEQPPTQIPNYLEPLHQNILIFMPDELPPGLPPMREIQHHIDLIPGSSLPIKLAYRMSPKEHDGLWRQVEEAIAKKINQGKFKPMCRTCIINSRERGPALLTQEKDGT